MDDEIDNSPALADVAGDGDDDRWSGISEAAWAGISVNPEPPAKSKRPAHGADLPGPDSRLTLEEALQRISPDARKVLEESLKGEIRELRRYTPGSMK